MTVTLLTSKDILERTGISRATLNNYISWGIVARPDVLAPEPKDGSAPRIGYFPEAVVKRIEEIQRLKKEGWSIQRITEHFGGTKAAPGIEPAPRTATPKAPAASPGSRTPLDSVLLSGLSIDAIANPAYMLNRDFEVIWLNDAIRAGASSNLVSLPPDAVSHGIFQFLLQSVPADATARRGILRFHLGLAKQLGVEFAQLCREIPPEEQAGLERLYREAEQIDYGLVAQAAIPAGRPEARPPLSVYAVQFQQGILFLYAPSGSPAQEPSALLGPSKGSPAEGSRKRVAALDHVAVLVTDLQDVARLWSELPPEEYFELANQVWQAADPIFRRHGAMQGKHPGEGMVWYFFPQAGSNYLLDAMTAAHELRHAVRRLSKEWQLRKGWATELHMNTGIDEGQEWLGTWKSGTHVELTMLGDTLARAARISGYARGGAVWVTRNLVAKVGLEERKRLKYGVHRTDKDGREAFVPQVFSRLENLHGWQPTPADSAENGRLPITELIDITGVPDRSGGHGLS